MTTVTEYCDHCNQRSECNAFTWSRFNGGTCYMKTTTPTKAVWASPPSDGPFIKSGISYKCQPLQSNTDRPGFDIDSAPTSTEAHFAALPPVAIFLVDWL